jgi:hypothetical protein
MQSTITAVRRSNTVIEVWPVREDGLIHPHHLGDRETGSVAHLDHLGGIGEVEGDCRGGFHPAARLAFPPNESARANTRFLRLAPVLAERREANRIRMNRGLLIELNSISRTRSKSMAVPSFSTSCAVAVMMTDDQPLRRVPIVTSLSFAG